MPLHLEVTNFVHPTDEGKLNFTKNVKYNKTTNKVGDGLVNLT